MLRQHWSELACQSIHRLLGRYERRYPSRLRVRRSAARTGNQPYYVEILEPRTLLSATGGDVSIGDVDTVPPTIISLGTVTPSLRTTAIGSLAVTFSEAIDPATISAADFTLTRDGSANLLTAAQSVTGSGTSFKLNGLSSLTTLDGNYVLMVSAGGLTDLAGNPGSGSLSRSWTMDGPVKVQSVVPVAFNSELPVADVDVTFTEPIKPGTFTVADATLRLNNGENLLTGEELVTQVSGNTWRISGLTGLTSLDGQYSLTLNATGINSTFGQAGVGALAAKWVLKRVPPSVTSISPVISSPANVAVETLNITFSEPLKASTFGLDDLTLTRNSLQVSLTSAQTLVQTGPATWQISGLNGLTNLDGRYQLVVSTEGIQDANGITGTSSRSVRWVQDFTMPSVRSIAKIAPSPRNTPVASLRFTLTERIQPESLDLSDVSLTRNGDLVPLEGIANLVLISGSTYELQGLSSLTADDGLYRFDVQGTGIIDLASNTGVGSQSLEWLMETVAPSSQVLPFATNPARRLNLLLSLTGSDQASTNGTVPSNIGSYDVYVSIDGGAFTLWKTVAASRTAAITRTTYRAESDHVYAFDTIARDRAGNLALRVPGLSTAVSITVPDLSPPITQVTSVDSSTELWTIAMSGQDVGSNGGVASFTLYVSVDGAAPQRLAILPGGAADDHGVYRAQYSYQPLTDGLPHTYRFYTVGKDGRGNTERSRPPHGIALSNAVVPENAPIGTSVGTFSTTQVESTGEFAYSLVSGPGDSGNGQFTIDASGVLRTTVAFDFETRNDYSLRVRSTDALGRSTDWVLAVRVANQAEAPQAILLSNATVEELAPIGTVVGTLSTVDSDLLESFVYSLVPGPGSTDNSQFTIAEGGSVRTASVFQFSTQNVFSIRVRSTDGTGLSIERAFTINTTSLNSFALQEQGQFQSERIIPVLLGTPAGRRTLSFPITATFDPTDVTALLKDEFHIYLVDGADPSKTLLDRGVRGTSLFTLRESGAEFVPGLVRFDGRTVEIDVSGVTGTTEGALRFELLSGDGDTGSRVVIGAVVNAIDPTGTPGEDLDLDDVAVEPGAPISTVELAATDRLRPLVSNVRFNPATDDFEFDLALRNEGDATGRQVVVTFPGLPAGVTLANASGQTAAGVPYISFVNAIPNGGLQTGDVSSAVHVRLLNPGRLRVPFVPTVLVGLPNRAPTLAPIPPQSLHPGDTRTIALSQSDPDGDPLTYFLESDRILPSVSLHADGRLLLQPAPDEIGYYEFDVVVSDGVLSSRQTVAVDVSPDPNTVTRISGTIRSTLNEPLAGVPVEIAGFSAVTASDGTFTIALPTMKLPTEAFNIAIPAGDVFLDPFQTGTQEIRIRRARFDVTTGDSIANPRQHPSLVTHFIDASMVYGSTPDRADALRTFAGGRLKTSAGNLLPLNDSTTFPEGILENDNEGRLNPASLFVSGDVRTNENVPLIALHTLLMREHNRLADELHVAQPALSDEALYQQARRLVGAMIQHITYAEYLPLMLGQDAIAPYAGYDPQIDPSESMLVAGAAFRLGHTQLASEIQRLGADGQSLPGGALSLANSFFTPVPILNDGIEPFLRGLAATPMQEIDAHVIDDVRNFLFGPPGSGGMDLASMNIQRGRDAGLPSYNQARVDFGLPAVTSFSEITSDPATSAALARVYTSVDDIDVWVGGISEDHAPGAMIGPLFQQILADQFRRSRDGDRFYYENGQFTAADLAFIRSTTLESLIERNAPGVDLPANPFTTGTLPAAPAPGGTTAPDGMPAEIRSITGAGNNLAQPELGAVGTNVLRNFTNGYADGISAPAGNDRPGPREISNAVVAQTGSLPGSKGATALLTFWGQILDHDLGLTPGGVGDTLRILGNQRPDPSGTEAYPFVAERMSLVLGHAVYPGVDNVIERPIYLPRLDVANGTAIEPTQTQTVMQEIAPGEMATVQVEAGTLQDRQGQAFTGVLSITEVPRILTPASLPEGLTPDIVVTIQPADLVFSQAAPLTLPNRTGLGRGILFDLYSINPITGAFDIVGTGRVTADGQSIETISGGILNSSWHFFCPNPGNAELDDRNLDEMCSTCPATVPTNSEVSLHSGHLKEMHELVSYQSQGVTRSLGLYYDTARLANDRRFFIRYPELGGDGSEGTGVITGAETVTIKFEAQAFVRGDNGQRASDREVRTLLEVSPGGGASAELPWGKPYGVTLRADTSSLPSGFYTADIFSGLHTYVGEEHRVGSEQKRTLSFVHVNLRESPIGAGWGLGGQQEVIPISDGSVVLLGGGGGQTHYKHLGSGRFMSPPGDYSTFERLSDGSYRHTQTDQTVSRFAADGLLLSITDRNGNVTTHGYDGARRLIRVTDPVGLQTNLIYEGSKLSRIVDPFGRTTQFDHDAKGNLTRITDPDGTTRTFTYDVFQRMTEEVDKLGFTERTIYGPTGRVAETIRSDGSVLKIYPAQTRHSVGPPTAVFVDGNGNSTTYVLNRFGQIVSSSDPVGPLGSYTRNSQIQVVQVTDGRGNQTALEYDARGNVSSVESRRFYVSDSFSTAYSPGDLAGQSGGVGWGGDWNGGSFVSNMDQVASPSLAYPGLASEPGSVFASGPTGPFTAATTISRPVGLPASGSLYVGVLANFAEMSAGNPNTASFLKLGDSTESNPDKLLIGRTFTALPQYSITARDDEQQIGSATQTVAVAFGTDPLVGVLDPLFGGDGIVTTNFDTFGSIREELAKVLVRPDGRILAVGYGGRPNFGASGLFASYNSDGTLDSSFSGDGLSAVNQLERVIDATHQPDGKIVAMDHRFSIVRMNANGTMDTSFGGGDGHASYSLPFGSPTATSLVLQADGKILMGGQVNGGNPDPDYVLVRCNPDGSLDTTFGAAGTGFVITEMNGYLGESIESIMVQPDGKIVVAGGADLEPKVGLVRYNSDGTLDTTFGGGDGIVKFRFASSPSTEWDTVTTAALQPDGKILVGGYILNYNTGNGRFALARILTDGTLDPTFGSAGIVRTDIGQGGDAAHSLRVMPDGRILLGGTTHIGIGQNEFALVRYVDNGQLDPTFGINGILRTNIPGNGPDEGSSLALLSDGKVLFGGTTGLGQTNSDFAIARYSFVDTAPIVANSTHYLVARIDFDSGDINPVTGGRNDRIRLYVDPLPGFEPLVADAEITDRDIGTLNMAGFQAERDSVYFDEIRMGNAYSDLFDAAANGPDRLLAARQVISETQGSESVAVGDVNGDGSADLVYPNSDNDTITIRAGNGRGTFGDAVLLATPDHPDTVALADLNGDARLDIVSANLLSNNVSVWLADGNGGFHPRTDFAVGPLPESLEVGDFNRDGRLDLITLGRSHIVTVLLNNGSGGFTTRRDKDVSSILQSSAFIGGQIAVGDLNNDGHLDAAMATYLDGKVALLLGNSTGNFPTISTFAVSGRPDSVAIADVNGDGKNDLAIARRETNIISVWRGDGTGQFPTREDYPAGNDPMRVAFFDLTGDGQLDLVSTHRNSSTLSVRPGNGMGVFGEEQTFAAGVRPFGLAAADLDGDGDRDLIVGSSEDRIGVYRNNTIDPVSGNQTGGRLRSTYTYETRFSQLTSMTDELGRRTLFDVDPANGNIRTATRVVGQLDATSGESNDIVARFTYTSRGLLDTATDPLGRVTDYDYDLLDRLVTVTMSVGTPVQTVRRYEYDLVGNTTAVIDENGNRTTIDYDTMNRAKRITEADPDGAGPLTSPVTTFEYDTHGNVRMVTDPQHRSTFSEYDGRDRLVKVTDELQNITELVYDREGNLVQAIDPLGQTTLNVYDRRDRLIDSIDPDGGHTRFAYDGANNLTQVTDPVGNVTTFAHDFRNRTTSETDPLGQTIRYEYDGANNLIRKTDRLGRVTEFAYDELNRVTAEVWQNFDRSLANEISYNYDRASNLTAIDDYFSALAFEYDDLDRLASVDNAGTPGAPHVVLDYTYDGAGNVLTVADQVNGLAGALTAYTYDALHRTTRITQRGIGILPVADKRVDFTYNALGQYQSITRYSDLFGTQLVVETNYTYDTLHRLTDLRHSNNTSDVAFYTYTYDADSRITSITDIDGLTTYSYDDRDQLIGADHTAPDNPDETYQYDANGNRLSSHLHGSSYVTGPGNRLLSDGTYTYTYDDEGNMLRRTEIATGTFREFNWDHRNRLIRVTDFSSGGIITQEVLFTYDTFGRRLSKSVDTTPGTPNDSTVTHFIYDREDVLLDFIDPDGSGPQPAALDLRYLHGPGIDQILVQESGSGNVRWLLTDHLGSVRDLVDNSSAVMNHVQYASFGGVMAESNPAESTRYLFTGREHDAQTDLYYYRARFYDSIKGRFVSEDPLRSMLLFGNNYQYVYNSPQHFTDPSGQFPWVPVIIFTAWMLSDSPANAPTSPAAPTYESKADYSGAALLTAGVLAPAATMLALLTQASDHDTANATLFLGAVGGANVCRARPAFSRAPDIGLAETQFASTLPGIAERGTRFAPSVSNNIPPIKNLLADNFFETEFRMLSRAYGNEVGSGLRALRDAWAATVRKFGVQPFEYLP